ncbi:MAG TPA: hypothetical protein P5257_07325 [Bacteroidales bacterium]|nr:hypothetical protein [Bacteroidales bacterium]HRR92479.1 hypothetical protein [Bacteroidales bacterium]HRT89915.1 hypothetical protein [Bacteroidales bacterium]
MTDFSDRRTLEMYSSAYTLSDMEVFVFPQLLYPLVIANIMSPAIWKWRDDPWFEGIDGKSFNYKANRIKQYIIQNYIFNLDLSTWGLTTKPREIERFRDFIDMDTLRQSNALFGYEGDKYYFDIDIRKHFGLDKYDSDIIPYWKTETVEAMNAFRHKPGFSTGAGECVSLSALYAAAMFVVAKIDPEKIFLIATPLHSQTFILEKEGLLTNNRRILTKNMWFNGTSLSAKARRALENEKVTIVANLSGYIHTMYGEATINSSDYEEFSTRLNEFLRSELTVPLFINFLRFKSKYKTLFQYRCDCQNVSRYISLEKMFEYEHSSRYNAGPETRKLLLDEIEGDDFHLSPLPGKLFLNDFEEVLELKKPKTLEAVAEEFLKISGNGFSGTIAEMKEDLDSFLRTVPRLPGKEKKFVRKEAQPSIKPDMTREEIIQEVLSLSDDSELCRLAVYAYRLMEVTDWLPYVKAAIERNPVSFSDLEKKSVLEMYSILKSMPDESIYDGNRLALPDEVWNFGRGDGIEKAFLLAANIINKDPEGVIKLETGDGRALLEYAGETYEFESAKSLRKSIRIEGSSYSIN